MGWDEILESAATETDTALSSRISSLARLTDAQIDEIAPCKIDKGNLAKILDIIQNQTLDNANKAQAIRQITKSTELLIGIVAKTAL